MIEEIYAWISIGSKAGQMSFIHYNRFRYVNLSLCSKILPVEALIWDMVGIWLGILNKLPILTFNWHRARRWRAQIAFMKRLILCVNHFNPWVRFLHFNWAFLVGNPLFYVTLETTKYLFSHLVFLMLLQISMSISQWWYWGTHNRLIISCLVILPLPAWVLFLNRRMTESFLVIWDLITVILSCLIFNRRLEPATCY